MNKGTSVYYLDTLPYLHKGRAVALGFFDGIHKGHRNIIKSAVKTAYLEGFTSTVITFVNFRNEDVLTTIPERQTVLETLGADELLVLDFCLLKNMKARSFLDEIIFMKLNSQALFAGSDYRFGYKAQGDASLLKDYCASHNIELTIFDDMLFEDTGRRISSTWLREAAASGDMELYHKLCGDPFSYTGKVIKDRSVGRTLGFPTANLNIADGKLEVFHGVYVSRVVLGSSSLYGITNVGVRPTFDDTGARDPRVVAETHIFNFDDDIYGALIRVELLFMLREEKKFKSVDDLKVQINADKAQAKTYLGKRGIILD